MANPTTGKTDTQNAIPNTIRVLGIDPGLNTTGYAVLSIQGSQIALVEAGVIKSKAKQSLGNRLASIHSGILDVIDSLKPDCMGLEELYSHYERPKTSIIMGHARGVICLAAELRGIEIKSYAATQVKKIMTGNGRANKLQVQLAVSRQLNLPEVPEPPDVADAMAIAVCHFYLGMNANPLLDL
jgi:crossover junction endodeoxyribonuclease RuvC